MLISIFASIWAENLGDELILKNEIKILEAKYSKKDKSSNIIKPKFIVFSYDYENPFFESDNIEYREYFPIWLNDNKNIFKNIKNFFVFLNVVLKSDLIVIWWGWLFFDNEAWNKKNPLDLWLFRKTFFSFFLKKIYFFRVWLSIKREDSFLKIRKIFKGKNNIIEVRDNYSKKILDDLWIENVLKEYDPVFWDNKNLIPFSEIKENTDFSEKKISLRKVFWDFKMSDLDWIDFKDKKVWIAFRSWYLTKNPNPELEILLIKEIIEFIQKWWWKVALLAHSFSKTDIVSNDYEWMKLIKNKCTWVEISDSMQETYSYYKEKKLDIVLAQRLHSIILSQVYEIPFVWISYSKKTNEILKELK